MKTKHRNPFWTSYSDLMTSLFFVMFSLFVVSLIKIGGTNAKIKRELAEANATKEQLQNILHLEEQFKTLSQSTSLEYDSGKKIFYAKDFQGIEIFYTNSAKIKDRYINKVDKVGRDILQILERLGNNNAFRYQMVIEGNAAIRWDRLKSGNYDPDNITMYNLSYQRALALYNRWTKVDHYDFRQYNTEIIIAGSGFNGNNRDKKVEENNKRFIIQIIPKISRPNSNLE